MHWAAGLSDISGMKPSLAARVRARMDQIGRSPAEVTRIGKLKRTLVYDILSGKTKNARGDNASKLAIGLDCDVGYLTGDQDQPALGDARVPIGLEEREPRPFEAVSTVHPYQPRTPGGMPVVDVTGGAGPGRLPMPGVTERRGLIYSGDAVRGEVVLPSFMLANLTHADQAFIHWLDVRGDSMEDTLSGGDWVGVNITDTAIGQGGVFALRDPDGEIIIKRLRKVRGSQPPKIEIVSDNPKQGSDVVLVEDVTVIGRVVARITRVG